ncbi:ArsR family transcriptional regulator [Natronorubrum sp. JWXQ-INN-674]|uniref:ArsR family transcriptional regulator n=1 Tax=Natronorubrum halalkaliphilum TaxID=2691917 RepID=A0A6B0VQ96_9EURY|nr:helix-turn-helix domain-containing protein [Natronorubrum halalkaliphilum]MXV63196.1 ArsR family transcriptional regulator [Natronorubrum halalkaliphilum]
MTTSVDPDTEELLTLLEDEYARTIILETYREARSADALSTACNADPSTVYRRIDRLQDHGLLEDQQRLDPNGHHYKVYAARLEHVAIDVTDDGFDVTLEYTEEDAADTFTRLYEEFSG